MEKPCARTALPHFLSDVLSALRLLTGIFKTVAVFFVVMIVSRRLALCIISTLKSRIWKGRGRAESRQTLWSLTPGATGENDLLKQHVFTQHTFIRYERVSMSTGREHPVGSPIFRPCRAESHPAVDYCPGTRTR